MRATFAGRSLEETKPTRAMRSPPSGCALGYGRPLADERCGLEPIFGQEALRPIDQEQDQSEADQHQADGSKLRRIEHIEEVLEEARAFDEDHNGRGAEQNHSVRAATARAHRT